MACRARAPVVQQSLRFSSARRKRAGSPARARHLDARGCHLQGRVQRARRSVRGNLRIANAARTPRIAYASSFQLRPKRAALLRRWHDERRSNKPLPLDVGRSSAAVGAIRGRLEGWVLRCCTVAPGVDTPSPPSCAVLTFDAVSARAARSVGFAARTLSVSSGRRALGATNLSLSQPTSLKSPPERRISARRLVASAVISRSRRVRVGRFHAAIGSGVTAMRSEKISAVDAISRSAC